MLRQGPGRPPAEESFPELSSLILQLVNRGQSAAENRRRTEALRTCATLDDLTAALKGLGINISRSAVYLRLLPRNESTTEGQRHYKAMPVKLIRAQNSAHREHVDAHFAAATISMLKDLAVIMGPGTVFFVSQDDKARVPLGLPAAGKQAPILMNLEYRVSLPDHDWAVGPRHKLIPSVYAACKVGTETVGYSGPTYISVRSGKHDSSTSASHAADFRSLLRMPAFADSALHQDALKPIVIALVDGGPDENPRFVKTLAAWYSHWKEFDLDAVFVACYAPGQSAFNPVERRMAPLSRDISGVILRHDACGTHLDSAGNTVDENLERRNFGIAGRQLAEVRLCTCIFFVSYIFILLLNNKKNVIASS